MRFNGDVFVDETIDVHSIKVNGIEVVRSDGTVLANIGPPASSGSFFTVPGDCHVTGNLVVDGRARLYVADIEYLDAQNSAQQADPSTPGPDPPTTPALPDNVLLSNVDSLVAANIVAVSSDYTLGSAQQPWGQVCAQEVVAAGDLVMATAGQERMRIASSGMVGLANPNPCYTLDVDGTVAGSGNALFGGSLLAATGDNGYVACGRKSLALVKQAALQQDVLAYGTGQPLVFAQSDQALPTSNLSSAVMSERLRLHTNGFLGVNNPQPACAVDIAGGLAAEEACFGDELQAANAVVVVSSDGRTPLATVVSSANNASNHLEFYNSAGDSVGSISTQGMNTSYNTVSDYRLKREVRGLQQGLQSVRALRPVTYCFAGNPARQHGFLAHEAQSVVPASVTGEKDGKALQAMDMAKLVPVLVAAVQELAEEVCRLRECAGA